MSDLTSIKAQASAYLAKLKADAVTLEQKAVAEYLLLKSGHYSLTVVLVAAAVGVIIGLVL